jgi:alkylation response protein AidB-like acyl-CoA dehydrogenase
MKTRAVRDGDHYVLTGSKSWITGRRLGFYRVHKTDPDAGRGIEAFWWRPTGPDSRCRSSSQDGVRGSHRRGRARQVRVPVENLIGDEHRAFGY